MESSEKSERQREARRRLSEQRRRAGLLRGRVIAVSLICFGLLWAVVFVQMATGNDPVLGDGSRSKATKTASAATPAEEAETTIEAEPSESSSEPESEAAEPEPEPLTTGQS